jgi:hypothetical protein
MVTRRQLEVLEHRIDALLPEERPKYRVVMRWSHCKVAADPDGTPTLPIRHLDEGEQVPWTFYNESDEDLMRRHPELRGKDGKLVPMVTLRFA